MWPLLPSTLLAPLPTCHLSEGPTSFYRLPRLEEEGIVNLDRLPFSIRILLENTLRNAGKGFVGEDDVRAVAAWSPTNAGASFPFMPSRVVLQDFTGVPAVVDLASMRSALASMGGDPKRINPVVPADLVIDHSVQVDYFGTAEAFQQNVEKEFERNRERYALLRWAQEAFEDFRVVPPGHGIVHQVNLEYLASVMHRRDEGGPVPGLSGHRCGNGLPHHHDQRPRGGRLGRRRNRGGGRPSRASPTTCSSRRWWDAG